MDRKRAILAAPIIMNINRKLYARKDIRALKCYLAQFIEKYTIVFKVI